MEEEQPYFQGLAGQWGLVREFCSYQRQGKRSVCILVGWLCGMRKQRMKEESPVCRGQGAGRWEMVNRFAFHKGPLQVGPPEVTLSCKEQRKRPLWL